MTWVIVRDRGSFDTDTQEKKKEKKQCEEGHGEWSAATRSQGMPNSRRMLEDADSVCLFQLPEGAHTAVLAHWFQTFALRDFTTIHFCVDA